MITLPKLLIFPLLAGSALAQDAWTLPRDLAQFQALLDRSPFSVPTAEESSPLADRYTITGAVSINDEPMVFILDKTTQERHMITKEPNNLGISLVEFLPDPDPRKMRASIRVAGQMATISYAELPPNPMQAPTGQPTVGQQGPGAGHRNPTAVVNAPTQIQPGNSQPNLQTPPRRVIRRRVISSQNPTGP